MPIDVKRRPSGIEGLGDMSWGTHFCLFYETREDLLNFFIPFFKAGLEYQEFCLCVASEPLIAEEAERAMREAFPDFDRYLAAGQIEITPHTDWYLKDGYFDEGRVLQGWIDKLDQALAKGFSGVRFAANILLEKSQWESFSRYEGKLEETLRDLKIEGLCAYNLNRYSAANVLDVMRHHQFTLARRDGTWEPLEGAQLKRSHEEVLKMNTELEQRVMERTAQLTAINEQLIEEIAERKRAEDRLRLVIDTIPTMVFTALPDGSVDYVNQQMLHYMGLSLEDVQGSNWDFPVHPEDRARSVDNWRSTVAVGQSGENELRVRRADGVYRWILGRFVPLRDEVGNIVKWYGVSTDIDDRKRAEEALSKSEANFRTLADKSLQGILIYQDQKIVYANSAHSTTTGYSIAELKSMSLEQILSIVHPLDREMAFERARKRMAGDPSSTSVELRIVRKDGVTRWIQAFNNGIEYYGRPALLSTTTDITERKRAEEALRKSERVLREAEVLGHTGSWEQNLVTGEIFNTEENLRLFFGDDRSKGVDLEDYTQVVHPDDREYVMQRRTALLEEEGPSDIEYRVVWPDGSVHVIFGRATVVRDERNRPIRVYGTNVDISERKQAEEEMNRQAERAGTLARIAARLNKQLDLDAVIHAVCEEAVNTFKVSQATMSLYDKKSDLLVYAGGVNIPPEYAATMEPITRSRFDDFLAAMGPIMIVPDIQSVPDVPNAEFSSRLDIRTVVTATMLRDQELVGVLVVGVNGHVREFDKDELTLLKAISDQAAQAIANAMLLKAANEQHEQLRALSAKLVETQETERQALTTELHDRVGQNLTGMSIILQNMKALLSDETAQKLAAKFDDAQALVEDTTRQIRDIMAELHLPELEDYGLGVALETYTERAASRGNLKLITKLSDLAPPPLPSGVRLALFRAAQEAISNVLKHANATQLKVSLYEQGGRIRLRVEDDGRGFDPQAASQPDSQTWGWKIMRERIESMGGNVQIESKPGAGTRVLFEVERPR